MKYRIKKIKRGDISLLITILVCGILLAILTPLSQKILVESNISKENLMSQQAIQAAKTGLDAWKYNLVEGNIDISNTSTTKNWPNINTDSSFVIPNPPDINWEKNWIVLNAVLGIQYRVEFVPSIDGGITPPSIISKGRVNKGNITIERAFEEKFFIPANCGVFINGTTRLNTCPAGQVGQITEQCNNGVINEVSNTCRNSVCSDIYDEWTSGSGLLGGLSSTQAPDTNKDGTLSKPDPYNYCSNSKPRSDIYNSTCNNWSCTYTGKNNCSNGKSACYYCQCLQCVGRYQICN